MYGVALRQPQKGKISMIYVILKMRKQFCPPNTAPRLAGRADNQEAALCQGPKSHTPSGSSIPSDGSRLNLLPSLPKNTFLIVGVWLEKYLTPQDIIKSMGLETNYKCHPKRPFQVYPPCGEDKEDDLIGQNLEGWRDPSLLPDSDRGRLIKNFRDYLKI